MFENKKKSTMFVKIASLAVLVAMLQSLLYMPVSAAPTGSRLRALAGSNFLIGYASRDGFDTMSDATVYQDVAKAEFNFLTPENAMKWDSIHPQQGTYNFTEADKQVAFAQSNAMKIHGHTLVWHSQVPSWVTNGSWTSATLTSVLYDHIDTVVDRYKNKIAVWDVANEIFGDNAVRRTSVWQNVIGNSYVELAFQRARSVDPSARLVYNDYNIETVNSKSTAVYNMLADFKNRGIPVDGVGFQMHLTNGGMDYNSFATNMARFAALGLEVYITEMDVRFPTPLSATDLQSQATIYTNVLAGCRAQAACKGLQVWGISDKYSWVPGFFPGQGGALLFDDNYNAKPAYYALQTGLGGIVSATNTITHTRTRTPTVTIPSSITTTVTRTRTPTVTNTGTGISPTPAITRTYTRSPTPTAVVITSTPTITPTLVTTFVCNPLTATITAPFTQDGTGTFCWQASVLGSYINSWNLTSLKVNGVSYTNLWAATGSLPAKTNGYWYISYSSAVAWGHFEAK